MAVIKANEGVVTQINVFTVSPESQQAMVDLLQERLGSQARFPGGFLQAFIGVWMGRAS